MIERPILFSGEMVRALLDGTKTQTRRPLKPQPGIVANDYGGRPRYMLEDGVMKEMRWPFGVPGDRLYVRETHALIPRTPDDYPWIFYRADGQARQHNGRGTSPPHPGIAPPETLALLQWKPSIHMPKWAARIWLEVTGVRVERVVDIDIDGIRAEGLPKKHDAPSPAGWFAGVWNAAYGNWSENPWVWVVEFRILDTPKGPR